MFCERGMALIYESFVDFFCFMYRFCDNCGDERGACKAYSRLWVSSLCLNDLEGEVGESES